MTANSTLGYWVRTVGPAVGPGIAAHYERQKAKEAEHLAEEAGIPFKTAFARLTMIGLHQVDLEGEALREWLHRPEEAA